MKKRFIIVGIIMAALLIVFASIATVFYSIPFVKLNNLIVSANKQGSYFEDTQLISAENHQKLSLLSYVEKEDDNTYNEIKTKKHFQIKNISSIVFECDIKVDIRDFDSWEIVSGREARKTVHFAFSKGKWRVQSVE